MATEQQPPLTADTWWNVVPGRKQGVTPLLERCKRLFGWNCTLATLVCAAYREFMECKAFVRDWDDTKLAPSLAINQMWREHLVDSNRYADDCQLLFGRMMHYNPDRDDDNPQQETRRVRIARTRVLISARNGEAILTNHAWDFGLAMTDTSASRRRGAAALSSLPLWNIERNVRSRHEQQQQQQQHVPEEAGHEEASINIAIRDESSGGVTCFKINQTTRMEELFQAYAESRGYTSWYSNYRFNLYGEELQEDQTPLSLDLHDYDQIDVRFLRPT